MTLIPPVIAMPVSQQLTVRRFADYCKSFDGTEVKVIEIPAELDATFKPLYPEGAFPSLQAHSFHYVAEKMKTGPFCWLEADCAPLQKGWLKTLTKAYEKSGKAFLLPDLTGCHPKDVASGIGIYPPESCDLIPQHYRRWSFDNWVYTQMKPVVEFTRLIQHSYAIYDEAGRGLPHRFPRDSEMLRPDAVLFHRDKYQGLIAAKSPREFYHTGCIGDIIAALPIIRQLGGGPLFIGNHDPMLTGWRKMEGPRYEALAPLLKAQPYLTSVEFQHGKKAFYDFAKFRARYQPQRTLTASQADWLDVPSVDMSPWLKVTASPRSANRIIIARTERYQNPAFPWRRLVQRYGHQMLFVGYPDEYERFVAQHGGIGAVQYAPTKDMLEVASLIAGSRLFIGNQSSPCWIAMGLGHPLIQETWPAHPDSRVERPNACFAMNASRGDFQRMGVPL